MVQVGCSNDYQETFVLSGGLWQYRYNIREVENPLGLEGEPQKQYQYDFVEVAAKERGVLIDAVISAKFDYPAQIGKAASMDEAERAEYAAFVQSVKEMVDNDLSK